MKTKTINLKYYAYWKQPYTDLINETISSVKMDEISAIDPYIDCIDYYSKVEQLTGCCFDYDYMNKFLLRYYTNVIGYHATKLNDVDALKKNGMRTFSKEEYIDIAHKLFGDLKSIGEITSVVNQFVDRIENMHLEFSYFKDSFLDDNSCLFLIYGSETLLSIANMIDGYQCRKRLRERNIPVIYKCNIPINLLTDFDKQNLFRIMFSRALRKMKYNRIQYDNTWCFELCTTTLESKYVEEYEIIHRSILDVYFDHCTYKYSTK